MKYDLSIVIPFHNINFYIKKLLDELLNIKKIKVEVVLINDGSTDSSAEICEYYLRNKNIIYFKQSHSGVSVARNLGIEKANGKYITFMDADDMINSDTYEQKVK